MEVKGNGDGTKPKPDVVNIQFEWLCSDLALPDNVKTRAWNVWQEYTSKADPEEKGSQQDWFTLAIYTAVIDASMPYGPGDPHLDKSPPCVTLTDLLKKSNVSVPLFIERMREFREEIILSDAVKFHLCQVEKRYLIVSPLFKRFDKEWGIVFREEDGDKCEGSVPFSHTEGTNYRKTLCWTLFLHVKDQLLGENPGLVHTYHLLLTCLEFIIRSTPSFQLQQPFDVLKLKSAENLDQNGYNVAVLQQLADKCRTSIDELLSMHDVTEAFFQSLKQREGELDPIHLKALYYERYRRVGDLDELQFLKNDPHLQTDSKLVPSSSPAKLTAPVTPVRAALNTIQQLKTMLGSCQDEPCSGLLQYFQDCSTNPDKSIRDRVAEMKGQFLSKYNEGGLSTTANQRFQLSARLYYRVLRLLLDKEKERLSVSDFSSLLNNDAFHRSLLACSVEIVLMTYSWNPSRCSLGSESQYEFPWVLEVFSLAPYDFYKVLESFIKAEPKLTREIIKHMTVIENRILDQIAWKSGSPLFEAISRSEANGTNILSPTKDLSNGHTVTVQSSTSSAAELCGCLSHLSVKENGENVIYLSPVRGQQRAHSTAPSIVVSAPRQGTSIIYTRESPEPQTRRSQSLLMFFNKVCRLGYHRLKALCDLLQVPKDIQQKIWTCFETCVRSQPEMLKNRHLDQIMMCSLYGVCKVCENEIKFKDIVKAYSTLPYTETDTYKNAWIEDEEYDSIITFYNRVYMHNMKSFILQFARPSQPNLSPVPRSLTAGASPSYSIPGRKNFYVSPMRESPFKPPPSPGCMTPRSKLLYSFGEGLGSSEKLKNITESVSTFRSRPAPYVTTPKSQKRLSFDNLDDHNMKGSDDSINIVVKKKRVNPPSVTTRSDESIKNGTPGSTEEDLTTIVVKKKRVNPPAVTTRSDGSVKKGGSVQTEDTSKDAIR